MLSSIVAVTLLVPDVDAAARAYQATLAYETVERGHVAPEQAALWGAERLAGREFVVLQPQSREPVYLRFVETEAKTAPAMRALGWNATEILVEDPVQLEPRLAGTPSAQAWRRREGRRSAGCRCWSGSLPPSPLRARFR